MEGVHIQHIYQETGIQRAAGSHEHDEKHEHIPYRRLPMLQNGCIYVEFLSGRIRHLPHEHAKQQGRNDAACGNCRRMEPVERFPVIEKEHQGKNTH